MTNINQAIENHQQASRELGRVQVQMWLCIALASGCFAIAAWLI